MQIGIHFANFSIPGGARAIAPALAASARIAVLSRVEEFARLGFQLVNLVPDPADPVRWTTGVVEGVLPRMLSI